MKGFDEVEEEIRFLGRGNGTGGVDETIQHSEIRFDLILPCHHLIILLCQIHFFCQSADRDERREGENDQERETNLPSSL